LTEIRTLNKVVLATQNPGKFKEIEKILSLKTVQLIDLKEIGFNEEIVEDGNTYAENARKKAETVYRYCNLPVIADDSGIEVAGLDGKPGVYSARFAGENADDEKNNTLLLKRLSEIPDSDRHAQFVCVALFYYGFNTYVYTRGTVQGVLISVPRGEHGFGYDPLFFLPEYDKTMAELDPYEKNGISHRAKAFQKLRPYIEKYF